QMAESGVLDAEIVDGKSDAYAAQLIHDAGHHVGVADDRALRELEPEVRGRESGLAQDGENDLAEILLEELTAGNVDRDLGEPQPGAQPGLGLLARRAQDMLAERNDEAGLFRDRYEVVGRDEDVSRTPPTRERFQSHDRIVVGSDLGLVEHLDLALLDRPAEARLE